MSLTVYAAVVAYIAVGAVTYGLACRIIFDGDDALEVYLAFMSALWWPMFYAIALMTIVVERMISIGSLLSGSIFRPFINIGNRLGDRIIEHRRAKRIRHDR